MYFYEVEGQDREKAVRKAETIFEQLDENGDGIYCICGEILQLLSLLSLLSFIKKLRPGEERQYRKT